MSIQDLVNDQELVRDWKDNEQRRKRFDDSTTELTVSIDKLEKNPNYLIKASADEIKIIDDYKTKINALELIKEPLLADGTEFVGTGMEC